MAAGAVQKAWDASPAGQDGALACAARAVAAVSVHVPVVVIVDDADCLDQGLAVTLVENLTARHDSQVLVVATMDPSGALGRALVTRVRRAVTSGLVYAAEANPDMGYESAGARSAIVPGVVGWRGAADAQRTANFAEVFTVAAAAGLAELARVRTRCWPWMRRSI